MEHRDMMLGEMALGLGDYGLIATMLGGVTGVVVVLVQGNIKALAGRIDRVEDRVDQIQKGKADKHEWARETLLARGKMGDLAAQISRVDAKLDANFGIAANIGRLVEELVRMREGTTRD